MPPPEPGRPAPGYGGGYPQPGFGPPQGPGYGPAVGYGGYSSTGVPMKLKHSPGRGLVIGLCGIAALLLSYFATPWISEGGEDVTFEDMREALNPDESSATTFDPNTTVTVPDLGQVPGGGQVTVPTTFVDPNAPQPSVPTGQTPTFNTVTPPSLPVVQTPTGSSGSDTGRDSLEQYTDWGWLLVLYMAIAGVVFSALLVPRDRTARFLTGTLTSVCLGWVNFFDKEGASAPRVLSGLGATYGLLIVVLNAWYLYWDKPNSPDPALGAWLSIAGAIAVLAGCIIGTKREWVPEYP
jgi:hypothetical protein